MNYKTVLSNIGNPDFKEQLIKQYQSTQDIISDLIYCFKIYNDQAAAVAKKYRTGDIKTDGKLIWSFIKDNIKYDAEPFKKQTTASFNRVIHNKHGDCKHSAIIASCIGFNMGYDVIFRFVSYDKSKELGHVYVLLQDPNTGEKVIVDPLQDFNYEKSFTAKKDYLAKNNLIQQAMLSRLTGLPKNNTSVHRAGPFEIKMSRIGAMSVADFLEQTKPFIALVPLAKSGWDLIAIAQKIISIPNKPALDFTTAYNLAKQISPQEPNTTSLANSFLPEGKYIASSTDQLNAEQLNSDRTTSGKGGAEAVMTMQQFVDKATPYISMDQPNYVKEYNILKIPFKPALDQNTANLIATKLYPFIPPNDPFKAIRTFFISNLLPASDIVTATNIFNQRLAAASLPQIAVPNQNIFQKAADVVQDAATNVTTTVKDAAESVAAETKKAVELIKENPFKAIALAPVRAAFDVLLRVNFRGWASHLNDLLSTNPDQAHDFGDKFGYNFTNFQSVIRTGAKEKQLGRVGVVEEGAVASAITYASPIIVALIPFLKSLGVKVPEDTEKILQQAAVDITKLPGVTPDGTVIPDTTGVTPPSTGFIDTAKTFVSENPGKSLAAAAAALWLGKKLLNKNK